MSEVATPSSQRRSRKLLPRHKLTPKEKAFVEAYCGDAKLDGPKAAALAGLEGNAQSASWKLLRRPRVRAAIDRRVAKRVAGRREIMGELSEVATAPWRDFITLQYGLDGKVVGASLNLGEKIRAADLLLKAHGAYTDQLTRALGKLAMVEVQRMLKAKRKAAKLARIERLSRRNQKLLAQGGSTAPPPVVDEVEAEVVQPDDEAGQGKATDKD